MDFALWIVGQVGIFLELIGAALGVWFAWRTKKDWEAVTVIGGQTAYLPGYPPSASQGRVCGWLLQAGHRIRAYCVRPRPAIHR